MGVTRLWKKAIHPTMRHQTPNRAENHQKTRSCGASKCLNRGASPVIIGVTLPSSWVVVTMTHRLTLAILLGLTLLAAAAAQPVPVSEAHGKVQKADKDTITLQSRDAAGKFGKDITLKLTGTSRITTLEPQTRDKKEIMAQKDTDPKDLKQGLMISVVYASPKGQDPVLLTAVIHPPEK
jgi:hypothetical protein